MNASMAKKIANKYILSDGSIPTEEQKEQSFNFPSEDFKQAIFHLGVVLTFYNSKTEVHPLIKQATEFYMRHHENCNL